MILTNEDYNEALAVFNKYLEAEYQKPDGFTKNGFSNTVRFKDDDKKEMICQMWMNILTKRERKPRL